MSDDSRDHRLVGRVDPADTGGDGGMILPPLSTTENGVIRIGRAGAVAMALGVIGMLLYLHYT